MTNRVVSLLNSSKCGNLFGLESKEIQELMNKYCIRADPGPKQMLSSQSLLLLTPNLMCQCMLTIKIWKN